MYLYSVHVWYQDRWCKWCTQVQSSPDKLQASVVLLLACECLHTHTHARTRDHVIGAVLQQVVLIQASTKPYISWWLWWRARCRHCYCLPTTTDITACHCSQWRLQCGPCILFFENDVLSMILTCLPNKFAGLDALLGCFCRQLQNVSWNEMLVCLVNGNSRVLVVDNMSYNIL